MGCVGKYSCMVDIKVGGSDMMKNKIKLVVFDLWKTLAYKNGNYKHYPLRMMLKKTNTKIRLKDFVKIYENSIQLKKWDSKYEAYKNLCKNMGVEPNKKNINLFISLREAVELRTKIYVHVIPMLKKLKKQGYKIGLISNTCVFSIKHIKKTNLLKCIDYALFSFDIGTIKPNLKAFRKMLKISKSKPGEAIMIGDKLGDDVIPPRKMGMNAIHYKDYRQLKKDFKKFGINL